MIDRNEGYTTQLKIEVEADQDKLNKLREEFQESSLYNMLVNKKDKEKYLNEFSEIKKNLIEYERISKALEDSQSEAFKQSFENAEQITEELQKQLEIRKQYLQDKGVLEKEKEPEIEDPLKAFKENFKNYLKDGVKKAFEEIGGKLAELLEKPLETLLEGFRNAWDQLLEASSYNIGSSLFAKNVMSSTQMTYGLSNAQAYGFDLAREMLGDLSEEDVFMMNDTQRAKFNELVDKYTKQYEEWQSSDLFDNLEEFTIEFAEFKRDTINELAQFFVENKSEIKMTMKALITGMEFITKALSSIVSWFGSSGTSQSDALSKTSDLISNYATNKNVNVNQTNNYNNVNSENKAWLQNSGDMSYRQIINYLSNSK